MEFHHALMAGCQNDVMLQLRSMMSDRAERYRRLLVRYLKTPRDDRAEH